MPWKYLGAIPDQQWRALLTESLDRADEFQVHMPDGEGILSFGRQEFLALPGVDVHPWTGMRDAIEISGPLTPAVRDVFLRLEPSVEWFSAGEKLWDYRLLQAGEEILSIGDFHDLQADVPE